MAKKLLLTQSQIYTIALLSGMPNPKVMAAIAMAESGGNIYAHNPNAGTGDNSYGLWQINMLGDMGPGRRKEFGISKNEDLFDPVVNARAAKKIQASQGLGAWSVYTSGAYSQYLGKSVAKQASSLDQVQQAKWWDPLDIVPEWMGPEALEGVMDNSGVVVEGIQGINEALKATADFLVNPRSWLRIGYGTIGAALVVGGLFLMVRNTAVEQTVGKVAKSVMKGAK